MNGPVPPQDEVIMGGGGCWSFLLCGPALKDFGGVFFFFSLAIPDKKYKQQSQQDVCGSCGC